MDSLTHALTGSIVGHAMGGKKIGPKAMLLGAVAANIPDFDVAFTRLYNPVEAMFVHRGFSHSLVLLAGGSLTLGYLLKRYHKGQYPFGFWWLMVLLPWLSHLAMDVFNTYGTALFEPFSSIRASFDSMAIIDVNLLFILVLTLIALFFFPKKHHRYKQLVSVIGLVLVSLYFTLNAFIKLALESEVKEKLTYSGIAFTRIHTTPLPLTNLVWIVLIEDSLSFRVTQVNILKKQIVSHTLLDKGISNEECNYALKRIKEFSKGYYTIEQTTQGYFYVNDLRFSSLESGYPKAYVLRFKVEEATCKVSRAHPVRGITAQNIVKLMRKVLL